MKLCALLFTAVLATAADPRLAQLTQAIDDLKARGIDRARLADIEIYQKAATWAVRFDEDSPKILEVLDLGLARAADPKFSWESQKGRVIRAYRSRIDDSVQPYAVTIPGSYDGSKPIPLQVVLHDKPLNEVAFIAAAPQPTRGDSIELEVFGRGNNGYRWAGETDVFEAIESVSARYRIDPRDVRLRGGSAAWHLALHYPDKWSSVEAQGDPPRTADIGPVVSYQQATIRIYDAAEYAANAALVPITGDSAEMRRRFALENVRPLDRRSAADPDSIHFVTYTPAYSRCFWIAIEALQRPYVRAEVTAHRRGDEVRVTTKNVARLRIDGAKLAIVDGQAIGLSGFGILSQSENTWRAAGGIARFKRAGLQGPIDDAFREAFLCVRPTGKPESKDTGEFARVMFEQFRHEFAKYMRGDIRVKDDRDVTPQDIERYHLILFGDRSSNRLIKKIAPDVLRAWPPGPVVPTLIAPNPLNRDRYVVLNSGHTFHQAEFEKGELYLYPRLGDFALIDAWGRSVIRAGLFNSTWRQLIVVGRQWP